MIKREITQKLKEAAKAFPVLIITGPRQSGKTTLCQTVFSGRAYVNLEAPDHRAFALEDPRGFLAQFPQGAIIDEVQRAPDLLSYLQRIIDDAPDAGKWIITGSQNILLSGSVSQSLAGRAAIFNLLPLTWQEISRFPQHPQTLEEALFFGSYPRIFDSRLNPTDWLRNYVSTYVERDVRMVSNIGDLSRFQRFVELCAGRTAQLLNLSSLAGDCGISQPTAKAWFSVLEASFITFPLKSFHANLRKRLVKMPKIHFYDTGMVCWLLGIRSPEQLRTYPLRSAIFESWVVSEFVKHQSNRGETSRALSFYRDQNGAEVDLIIETPSYLQLIEAKSTATASSNLLTNLNRVRKHFDETPFECSATVIYGGDKPQRRKDVDIVPWRDMISG
ncbi:MAG: ATP-binding protein [Rhodothermaceae bacterium]|nr:ATP-binding protein [Rhodothermaceae bacterium]MXZ57341.1 ATP-binding protein [Rhodothermaceae bacterium]MYB90620.1 ATP-binding protein [Rhodothermaceae bacterium]MYD68368.1 ATP-binding protein [Rhodothermaceae bacterium]MYG44357.1 ATP-binding protein [Rhodothermaceae bacterium]